jgi:hypothetical protein
MKTVACFELSMVLLGGAGAGRIESMTAKEELL